MRVHRPSWWRFSIVAWPSEGESSVMETIEQARREFAAGQCQAMTAAEIVREGLS